MNVNQQARYLFNAYLAEMAAIKDYWEISSETLMSRHAILKADPHVQVAFICLSLDEVLRHNEKRWRIYQSISNLLTQLSKRRLPYTPADIQSILSDCSQSTTGYYLPFQSLLRGLSRPLADPATLQVCRTELQAFRNTVNHWYIGSAAKRRLFKLIDEIQGGQQEPEIPIFPDHWGKLVQTSISELEEEVRKPWLAILCHCASASGSVPSHKWSAAAQPLVNALDQETFVQLASELFNAFSEKHFERLDEQNADLLKGLAWCCIAIESVSLAAVLADAAIEGYRKLPGIGPRAAKIASACVYALKNMSGLYGAAQLERIRLNVKQPSYRKVLEQSLDEAAQKAGMNREDLEEITIPSFDLEQQTRCISVGHAIAAIKIVGLDVQLQWYDARNQPRKAVPAEIKREHKQELKDLKRLCDDIKHLLKAQRNRIERLPLTERSWSLADWRERYLDHPLVSCVARNLIWRFTTDQTVEDGIWHEGQLVDVNDQPLTLSETTRVTTWHPVFCQADEVRAWRNWFEQHQVKQPFKQAHREIYLLTDAERQTQVYSNRFASHILRQHQFNALAAERGWRNQLRLMVDDSYEPASLELPHWNLRAEFWIEGAGDDYQIDTNEVGTYLRLATDQVRFYQMNTSRHLAHAGGGGYIYRNEPHNPIPLEQISPLVLSEVLRDVDLFVGVASVGNDPTWQDGGPQGRYQEYWHSYSFGELSATAQTRKQLLERLVPRLTITKRCVIEGHFLRVQGDLRTYKIHLGSGNILMEPNDQYLCIVKSRENKEQDTIFLPFDGDAVFSIILSKAFLLAEDSKITDPTITRQINVSHRR